MKHMTKRFAAAINNARTNANKAMAHVDAMTVQTPQELSLANGDLKESVKDLTVALSIINNAKWALEKPMIEKAHKILTLVAQQQDKVRTEIHFIRLAGKKTS